MLGTKCFGGPYIFSPMISKEIIDLLRNIDTSLQIIANSNSGNLTTSFINKKAIASRLGVAPVTIDKLIFQGVTSKGQSGLVEGRHYCRLDPTDSNTSNFLFDSAKVLQDAWTSFTGY
jgi:hypothetical protein